MGRFRRHMHEEYAKEFSTDERYNIAYRKVKRIKGFYAHLRIYLIINVMILIASSNVGVFREVSNHEIFWSWDTFSIAISWGIGLVIHGLSVFGRDLFFSDDWEEKKIQEYMDKQSTNTNKWE